MNSYSLTIGERKNKPLTGHFAITLILGVITGFLVLAVLGLSTKWMIFTFMGLVFPFIAILSGSFKRFILGVMLFSIPLNVDVHFLYNPEAAGMHGIVLGFTDICLFLLLSMWFFDTAMGNCQSKIQFFPKITLPFVLLVLISALSTLNASQPLLSLFDIVQMIKVYVLFLYLANNIATREQMIFAISILAAGMALQALIVFLQYTTGTSLGLFGQQTQSMLFRPEMDVSSVRRPGGTVGHANTLGRYFVLLLPVGISLFFRGQKKFWFGLTTALGFVGMVCTL